MKPPASAIAAALLFITAPSAGRAATFLVHPGGENKVSFTSRAAMESFEGKTSRLEGSIVVDPATVGDSATVHFEVDLASLDTGIAKRNQHMREAHLETATYPKAVFDGVAIRPGSGALSSGKPVTLDVEGTFTLHGVAHRIQLTVVAAYKRSGKEDRIEFQTAFPVALADYRISRPQFLFLKLADVQQVRVRGVAVASP